MRRLTGIVITARPQDGDGYETPTLTRTASGPQDSDGVKTQLRLGRGKAQDPDGGKTKRLGRCQDPRTRTAARPQDSDAPGLVRDSDHLDCEKPEPQGRFSETVVLGWFKFR